MSPRAYPPLKPREVVSILNARGFVLERTRGDHEYYVCHRGGEKIVVTVDRGVKEYDINVLKSMIRQSKISRKSFYCTLKKTAKKIGMKQVSSVELDTWLGSLD